MVCVASISASANADDKEHRPLITDVINSEDQVETDTHYFYVPDYWRNEYNDYYYYNPETKKFDGDGGNFAAGLYWWDGPYDCPSYLSDFSNPWPGYAVTETVDGNPNILKAEVPKSAGKIIWNNLVDGGIDSSQPAYSKSYQTEDILREYYDPGEDRYGLYPNGIPEDEGFDGKIYVCNPNDIEENPLNHRLTYRGAWFYYYGDGEYGIYKTREEAEENDGVYKNGDFPEYNNIEIDKKNLLLEVGETDTVFSSFADADVKVEDDTVVSISTDSYGYTTVKALKPGETTISFSRKNSSGKIKTVKCNVIVAEDRIKSITVDDVELTEGLDAECILDEDNDKYYFYYSYDPSYVIHFADGSSERVLHASYDYEYKDEELNLEMSDDQSYSNQWKAGVHKVTAEFAGHKAEFNVKIKTSPVKKITVDPAYTLEDIGLDDDGDSVSYKYAPNYKVTMQNGAEYDGVLSGETIEINNKDYAFSFVDDQSENNKWASGKHKATAMLLGQKVDFDVNVVGVLKVKANDLSIIKGAAEEYYDEDSETTWNKYQYDADYYVVLQDGTLLNSESGEVDYKGTQYYMSVIDDQSYDNEWKGTGTHKVKGTFGAFECDFNVDIVDSPVERIKADTLELIDKVDGRKLSSGQYEYVISVPEYTVVLNDGSTLKSDDFGCVTYKGHTYSAVLDKDCVSGLKVGETHKSKITVMGKTDEFDVKVIESPVKSIEVSPIEVIENVDGSSQDGKFIYEIKTSAKFSTDRVFFTVTLNDGTVLEGDEFNEVIFNDRIYRLTNDCEKIQKSGEQWTVGNTYEINVSVLGVSAKAKVKVVPNPVKKVEVEDLVIKEHTNGDWYDTDDPDGDKYWYLYNVDQENFKVVLKDGTELYGNNNIKYKGKSYYPDFHSEQVYKEAWGVGEHEATIKIMGVEQTFKVIIEKNEEETNPDETKPAEPTEPVTNPDETKPAEPTEPVTNPDETKPAEPTEPVTNPDETKPAEPTEPAETNPSVEPTVAPQPSTIEPGESDTDKPAAVTEKKANPIKVTAKAKTVKAKKLKKKAQKVKALTVKKAQGKVTYKLVKKGTAKKIYKKLSINKNGVLKIKKGKLKKGTYKIKIAVTAKGNTLYKGKTITKIVRIKVK
jgi:hypothetical protein